MKDFFIVNAADNKIFGTTANGVGMDVVYDEKGFLVTLEGKTRLAQALQKMLLTKITTEINKITEYGSNLANFIGTKIDPFFAKAFIATDASDALERYKNMQQQIASLFDIPDEELLRGIADIQIQEIDNEPTRFAVILLVQNENDDIFPITMSLAKSQ